MLSHLHEHSRAHNVHRNVKLFTQTRITRKMALALCCKLYCIARFVHVSKESTRDIAGRWDFKYHRRKQRFKSSVYNVLVTRCTNDCFI